MFSQAFLAARRVSRVSMNALNASRLVEAGICAVWQNSHSLFRGFYIQVHLFISSFACLCVHFAGQKPQVSGIYFLTVTPVLLSIAAVL